MTRVREAFNELIQREHLLHADSHFLRQVEAAVMHAVNVFEDMDYAVQWFKEQNTALGSVSPLSLLATEGGIESVHAELDAVAHGLPV